MVGHTWPPFGSNSPPRLLVPSSNPSLWARTRLTTFWRLQLFSRGAQIRTGDLCDPNAALYRTEPRPEWSTDRGFATPSALTSSCPTSGRGGIRTHAGVYPHDFQSCALSHSATRPKKLGFGSNPLFEPTLTSTALLLLNGGGGIHLRSPSAILGGLQSATS